MRPACWDGCSGAAKPVARRPFQYFDGLYAASDDPWSFETSDYERTKYEHSVAALPAGRRFRSGFEIGCSIGVLTASLAARCDALLAVDLSEAALASARRRNASAAGVRFERMAFDTQAISRHARLFGADVFKSGMRRFVQESLATHLP